MNAPLVILAYPKIDHEKDYVYHWVPFSLLTLAKTLLDNDAAEVILFDGNEFTQADWEALLDRHLPYALCIGISIMTGGGQIAHALRMAQAAKSRPACPPIVFGGPHVNVLAEQTLHHPLVDAILIGPGQNSIFPFVDSLLGRRPLESVPGLMMYRNAQRVVGPPNSPRTSRLGRYPWNLVRVEDYVHDDPTISSRTLNYVSSQGCIYKCRFCYELVYNRKYSAVPASQLLEDVEFLCSRFNICGVKFYDADFFIDLRRVNDFCRGLLERGIAIRWAASINPNDVLRARRRYPAFLELLAKSGCSRLLMGIESGSDRVLNEIVKKEMRSAQAYEVASQIAATGILGSYTFILGFPGETHDEQEQTYALIDDLQSLSPRPETRIHLFAPYPGTPLYEDAVRWGYEPPSSLEAWAQYDYYDSQTPWTTKDTVGRARANTNLRLSPTKQQDKPNVTS